jgi:hypothetical protein
MPVQGPLAFEPLFSFSRSDAKLLRDHFFTLVDIVSAPAARFPKLVQAEFEQAIMVMSLRASRHTHSHRLEGGGPDAALAAVRRAEDHIEANWQQPIALEDLAAMSGGERVQPVPFFQEIPRPHADAVRRAGARPRASRPLRHCAGVKHRRCFRAGAWPVSASLAPGWRGRTATAHRHARQGKR